MFSYMICVVILTLCYILWMIFIPKHKKIDPPLPPGPLGFPIVGSLFNLNPDLHSYFTELSKTYGPIASLRLGTIIGIVVSSPSIAKEVLKDFGATFGNHDLLVAGRESSYGGFGLAVAPYGPKWRMLRKVCVREMLGCTNLNATYNLRKHEIHKTMLYFQEQAGTSVNIGDQMFLTTLNVVMSMLWGSTVKNTGRTKLGAEFRSVVTEITNLLGAPNVSDYFPWLERFDLHGVVRKMRDCRKRLDDVFEVVIDEHRKIENVESGKKDFLHAMMKLVKDSESSGDSTTTSFTMLNLKALLADIIVGGSDTSSLTLELAMAEIVSKPEVMKRAQQELESSHDPLEESNILQLPYLQAIMKETLRLHPILPLLIPHSPSESCVVGGYTIPKGSRAFINVWAIHRDPSLWEDPLEFKPERFLDGRYDFSGNDLAYFPFGAGRRNCAGIALAERMILYSLASMLHYFDWKLPQGVKKLDLEVKFGNPIKKMKPLFLIPSPRSSNLQERKPLDS